MKLVSIISSGKSITVITAILVLASVDFQFYHGAQTYAQETDSIEFQKKSITKILNFR